MPVRLEPLFELAVVGAEDLEIHDRAQSELGTRCCRRAAEAAVADGRDSRAKALQGSVSGDRVRGLLVDPPLPFDVQAEPGCEVEAIAEAGVHRVLDVAVGVDEARQDDCLRVVLVTTELGDRPHGGDQAVFDRYRSSGDRRSLDRDHPVR